MLKIHQLFLRTFVLIFLGILFTLTIVTYFWSKNIYMNQIEKNLIQNIDTFSIVVKDLNNIDTILKDLKASINLRITVIDEKGNVIAESDQDKNLMENHSNREEVLQAKDFGIGKVVRFSNTINKELLYIAKKVTIDKSIYFIRMADYTNKITDNFIKLTAQIFGFIAFFLIIGFFITYSISIKIKKQITNKDKARKLFKDVAKKYQENLVYYSGQNLDRQGEIIDEIFKRIEYQKYI